MHYELCFLFKLKGLYGLGGELFVFPVLKDLPLFGVGKFFCLVGEDGGS